jgi:hypothetical protein
MPSVAERVVAVLGVGSMRCGQQVLAALAGWDPDAHVEVRLFDANEERLDLLDRFFREALDWTKREHLVRSTGDSAEALEGAFDLIVCLHEDCARRMRGRTEPPDLPPQSAETRNVVDLTRGDPNRPTPRDRLSKATRSVLTAPSDWTTDRDTVMAWAVERLLGQAEPDAKALNLVPGLRLPHSGPVTELDWPPPLAEEARSRAPHQILRWIQGDPGLMDLIDQARTSPLVAWLGQ